MQEVNTLAYFKTYILISSLKTHYLDIQKTNIDFSLSLFFLC